MDKYTERGIEREIKYIEWCIDILPLYLSLLRVSNPNDGTLIR